MATKRLHLALPGTLWLGVGIMLLTKGLGYLLNKGAVVSSTTPLVSKLSGVSGGAQQAALILVAVALLLGYIKGKGVLTISARRQVERYFAMGEQATILKLFDRKALILMGSMMLLGKVMTWCSVPVDVRGLIDVAVGSGLIHGSIAFFKIQVVPS